MPRSANRFGTPGRILSIAGFASIVGLVAGTWTFAGEHEEQVHEEQVAPVRLPDDLRGTLVQEMIAVQQGTHRIVDGLVSGDWDAVAAAARQIEESYILKKTLSPKQRETLHHTLPETFRRLDAELHRDAARLARAAKRRDGELATFRFHRLLEGCVTCHQLYAAHRFPGHATRVRP